MGMNQHHIQRPPAAREPLFNLPAIVLWLLVLLLAVHAGRMYLLDVADDYRVLVWFSFIPARFNEVIPGGQWAQIWSFVTYGLLHGSWEHLIVNALWLTVFGSAVAWRFGVLRFVMLTLACTAAGAIAHLVAHFQEFSPMVGASAAISGYMAVAARFVFEAGGPLGALRGGASVDWWRPATPFIKSLSNRSTLAFLAIWFGMNILFGLGTLATTINPASIAWEAHIGGFLAGLLLFPVLDPVGPVRRI
jgi:membrane associated rhomboid family serine protease